MSTDTHTNTPEGVLYGKGTQKTDTPAPFDNLLQAINAEMEQAGTILPDEINALLLDFSEVLPPPEIVYQIDGAPVFTRGNISCVTGKAKSRKSFLFAMMAADVLKDGKRVLYIDTEQSRYHAQKQGKRILATAELCPDEQHANLRFYFMKETPTESRRNYTEQLIKYKGFAPDVVFIDGLRDLIKSINDEEEATAICDLLMNLASTLNTAIVVILHENKGENNNVRGHIGTEIVNKAETVIEVTRTPENKEISRVEAKFCRNREFTPFCFTIDNTKDFGIPVKTTAPEPETEGEREYKEFKKAFGTREALTQSELVKYLMGNYYTKKGELIGESGATSKVNKATSGHPKCRYGTNIAPLIKDETGRYRLNPAAAPVGMETEIKNYYETEKEDEDTTL